MTELRQINRILCYVPTTSIICWATMLFFSILRFGRLPIYGLDPDPYSLSIDWLNFIGLLSAILSFFTIPTTVLITIHLAMNKVELRRADIIALVISLSSVVAFIISKYYMTDAFLWIMD